MAIAWAGLLFVTVSFSAIITVLLRQERAHSLCSALATCARHPSECLLHNVGLASAISTFIEGPSLRALLTGVLAASAMSVLFHLPLDLVRL